MTTKEAVKVAILTARGVRVKFNSKYVVLTNILDTDKVRGYNIESQHNFSNMHRGIYTFYDKSGNAIYSMCFQDKNKHCIYQCNINEVEIVRNNDESKL